MTTDTRTLGTAQSIADFDLAKHDAVITLTSPKTGDHRTVRIRTIRKGTMKGHRLLELLVGRDNANDYLPFAFVGTTDQNGVPYVNVWKAYKGEYGSGGSVHEKLALMVRHPQDWIAKGVGYQLALRCRKCGRQLTRPDSIALGIGPECATMWN